MEGITCLEVQEMNLWSIDAYTTKEKVEEKEQLIKLLHKIPK